MSVFFIKIFILINYFIFVSIHIGFHNVVLLVYHLPPTSEVGGSHPGSCVGKLVVAYQWSAVYIAEP